MNKYANLVRDVYARTRANSIPWVLDVPNKYAEYIFNAPLAYRCFQGEYKSSGVDYILLMVEKKAPAQNEDTGMLTENHFVELSIIKSGKLIFTITDEHVGRQALVDLLEVVEDTNSDAEKLFKIFE